MYDENSFIQGIAVGRQLKGWATDDSNGGGGGTTNTGVVIVPELFVQYDACFIMPAPIICTITEE